MKQLPWIISTLLLIVVVSQLLCNKPAPSVPKPVFDQLQQQYNDSMHAYNQFCKWSDSAMDATASYAVQANEQLQASRAALEDAGATVNMLLAKLDSASREKPDSTWVSVSPRYKDGCDSLRHANLTLNYSIMQFEQDMQAQASALAYETHIRDSIIERERAFNAQFQRQLDYSITAGKQVEKAAKQKLQIYGGFAGWFSQVSPFGGGEINLSLLTPRDQMYEIKGAYLNGWWVGVGTKFKFHF